MNIVQSITLGIIQGLTEFLPVSSSGHLVIAQTLFAISQPPISFDIFVHVATLVAVIIFFRQNIFNLNLQLTKSIIFATIPTGIIGLLLRPYKSTLFNSLNIVILGLLVTTALLLLSNKRPWHRANQSVITFTQAFIIGIAQGLAIIPGVSRSGATIIIALMLGLKFRQAFSFSFLISIPAIAAALILQLSDLNYQSQITYLELSLGFVTAAITGIIALSLLERVILYRKIHFFAGYTLFLALITPLLASLFS